MRALSEPSRLAAAVFLLLIFATIGAFFVAQRLKQQPPLLRYRASDEAFSPNGDGFKDTARIRFMLPEGDEVTVTILDEEGGRVARVARNRYMPEGEVELEWDGRTGDGAIAPEDTYRVRVGLRDQGRTNTLPHAIDLDVTPPRPRIEPVGGPETGPIVIDRHRRTASAEVARPGRDPRFSLWRTDTARPQRVVGRLPESGRRRARWNGRIGGRPAPPGTYMISASARDKAGNRGSAPRALPPARTGDAPGGVGVWVRPIAITPPLTPVAPGRRAQVRVDVGGRSYRWVLRRVGDGRVARGRARTRRLRVPIPDGPAGAYVLTVRIGTDTARAVIPARSPRPRPVLVVLPALTWQGENEVDDDGDGLPDSLARGRDAVIERPFLGGGLPRGFRRNEAGLLTYLDAQRLRYELTTDLALARAGGAPLDDHDAVVLAGDMRWLPEQLGEQLDGFVRDGGRLLTLGVDSLRRTISLGGQAMTSPSDPLERDFLGARVGTPVAEQAALIAQSDDINLFAGTAGSLGSFDVWEETADVERGRLLAVATTPGGEQVLVAYRRGRGLVVRPGVRGWSAALEDEVGPAATTTRRIWTLLRR